MNKTDIPIGERGALDVVDVWHVPDLPGDWEWRKAYRTSTNKTNVYFGIEVTTPGGWLGEIDNYYEDGEEVWDVHIREILEAPEHDTGTIPAGSATTVEQFNTLKEAIESVPSHIGTHYLTESQ